MSAALRMLLLLAAGLLLAPVAVSAHVFPENRVRGVSEYPSGQNVETLPLSQQTATGCASCPAETASGRALWLSRDPLDDAEFIAGPNLYTYASNDPINRIDPLGLIDSIDTSIVEYAARGDVSSLRALLSDMPDGALSDVQKQAAKDALKRIAADEAKKLAEARLKQTAQKIISNECKGSINSEFPGQFYQKTLAEITQEAKNGDDAAQKALKLLNDSRFKK